VPRIFLVLSRCGYESTLPPNKRVQLPLFVTAITHQFIIGLGLIMCSETDPIVTSHELSVAT